MTSGKAAELCSRTALSAAMASGLWLLLSDAAWASGGAFTGGALDLFTDFLDKVEAMGPAGAVLFVVVVMLSEMIPLFPTQPLSLASGLLFGGKQGAILMLIGVTLAAFNAFVISRGIGRELAEKVIHYEMDDDGSGPNSTHSVVARKLAEVQRTIETGTFWQQLIAIALLRLTPIVPFSASNYVLGLTPLQLPAFLGGTVLGMSVWSVLYASLGGAGRGLLENGMDLGSVFAELAEKSGSYTQPVLIGGGAVAGVAALVYFLTRGSGGEEAAAATEGAAAGGKGAGSDIAAEKVKEEQLLRK